MDLDATAARELLEQPSFLMREMHRQDNLDTSIEVAVPLAAQAWHTLASETEHAVILRLWRNCQHQPAAIGRRHGHLAAEHGLDQFDIDIGIEIVAFTLECRIGLHADYQVEVAARPAADAGLTFARHANTRAIIDAGGDLHLDAFVARDHALPVTG